MDALKLEQDIHAQLHTTAGRDLPVADVNLISALARALSYDDEGTKDDRARALADRFAAENISLKVLERAASEDSPLILWLSLDHESLGLQQGERLRLVSWLRSPKSKDLKKKKLLPMSQEV